MESRNRLKFGCVWHKTKLNYNTIKVLCSSKIDREDSNFKNTDDFEIDRKNK